MDTKETQQDVNVFTDYDNNKGKDINWTKTIYNQQPELVLGHKLNNAKQRRNCTTR